MISVLTPDSQVVLTDSPKIKQLPRSLGDLTRYVSSDDDFMDRYLTFGGISLRRLVFGGASGHHNKSLRQLPAILPPNLEELVLDKCKSLESIPASIGSLTRLNRLSMKECKTINEMPESIGDCRALVEMDLAKCTKLETLPSTIGALSQLEDLTLSKCLSLERLPDAMADLTSLVQLDLRNCARLESIPASLTSRNDLTIMVSPPRMDAP